MGINEFQESQAKEEVRKPNEPQILVAIFYAPHGTKEDMEGLLQQFAKADVYIPEAFKWEPVLLKVYRDVAEGIINPDEGMKRMGYTPKRHPLFFARLEMLYNSHKPVAIIDVPNYHPIAKRYDQWRREHFEIEKKVNFSDVLNLVRKSLMVSAGIERDRELYMIGQLRLQIPELPKKDPILREKKEITVLLSLGSGHTGVYQSLAEMSQEFKRRLVRPPDSYSFWDQGVRRCMLGREIDDHLAARIFLEIHPGQDLHALERITKHTWKGEAFIRKVISQFNIHEAKMVFERARWPGDFRDVFAKCLDDKGIKIPQSEAELDKFLAAK